MKLGANQPSLTTTGLPRAAGRLDVWVWRRYADQHDQHKVNKQTEHIS
jgi:hypothetical protein